MKRTGRWFLRLLSRTAALVLAFCLLPFVKPLLQHVFPDITGKIVSQCELIERKLQSSQRLEVTRITEEGAITAKTNVILLGTVGSAVIRYLYTSSIGVDLSNVMVTADGDRILFSLPEPEVLNDGIQALDVKRNNVFSFNIDKSTEALLEEQRLICRENCLSDPVQNEKIWNDTKKALEETVCRWVEDFGEKPYQFEFISAQ